MLSYQHLYHAGNTADVHKHALLAWALDYLTRKDKPLTYLETHAGRGLYNLAAVEALKTGEAAQGVNRLAPKFADAHPYARALADTRTRFGASAYPGSPLIAASLLRDTDVLHLAELHPGEHAHLDATLTPFGAKVLHEDGWQMAISRTPPTPRRGLMLIDPSWEVKTDYETAPKRLAQIHKRWNVGIVMLWYPVLSDGRQRSMTRALTQSIPDILLHEVSFPPAQPGHRMVGSGLAVINPPYGFSEEAAHISALFDNKEF
ncbi:MAG: 23S rRNA (adenine(2030)-N(6))-methyltransferase RlmJ [Dinoroseobacter sp.]|nr:23S rRNA (adenine(2030)-N(6))-methyltransferase RlmJ [Dinoroseobacter sp.]